MGSGAARSGCLERQPLPLESPKASWSLGGRRFRVSASLCFSLDAGVWALVLSSPRNVDPAVVSRDLAEGVGWGAPGPSTLQDPDAFLPLCGWTASAPGPLSALVPTPVMFHLFGGSRVWDQVWQEPPTKGVAYVGSIHWETDRLGPASGTTALNPRLQKRNKMTKKAPRT